MDVTFVHCESYGCKNITSDLYKENFGAYCFEHSSKVKSPFGTKTKFSSLSPISPRRIVLTEKAKESVELEEKIPRVIKSIHISPEKETVKSSKKSKKTKSKEISSPYKSKTPASSKNSLILPLPGEEEKEEQIHLPDEEEKEIPFISPGMDLTFENYESSPIMTQSIRTSVPSPRRTEKFVKKVECCYCTDPYDISKVMKCGHMICPQCLEGVVRSPYCEFCKDGSFLEGPFMTEKIQSIIDTKYKQDMERNNFEESEEYSEEYSESSESEEEFDE
jgi:hypothetical protein